jgi:hypothetical protein
MDSSHFPADAATEFGFSILVVHSPDVGAFFGCLWQSRSDERKENIPLFVVTKSNAIDNNFGHDSIEVFIADGRPIFV